MSQRIKCPCGQVLKTPENATGKQVRCPKCERHLRVPGTVIPLGLPVDTFLDPPPTTPVTIRTEAVRTPFSRTPVPFSRQRPRNNKGLMIGALVVAVTVVTLGISGLAVWLALPLFQGSDPVASNFEPMVYIDKSDVGTDQTATAPIGRNANETAMLEIADRFIRHARDNEHREATAMLDTKLFNNRLYSPKGSYEAIVNDVPAEKLLSNFGSYALDGAEVGGRRHWQIIGISQFDGSPGVVLRYYVEPKAPLDAITDPALFKRMAALIKYDQVSQLTNNLLISDGVNPSQYDHYRLDGHPIRSAFPSRAGYMMLVFDCQETTPRLADLVNVLGQAPLSRTGAHVFLANYQMLGVFRDPETFGTKRSSITVYGISDRPSVVSWDKNNAKAEQRAKQRAADEAAAVEQRRPKRLERLVDMWLRSNASFKDELSNFRRDFPNDLGFEMAIVLSIMGNKEPTITPAQDITIIPAAKALFEHWKDPFFLYVQALSASQNGRKAEAEALFDQCIAAGFGTTDLYIDRIKSAIDRSDVAQALAIFQQWNQAWARDGKSPDPEKIALLARRFNEFEKSLNPDPTLGEAMAAGRRGPTGLRERMGRDRGFRDGNDRRFGGPTGDGSNGLQPRTGGGPVAGGPMGRSMQPPPSGPQVIVKISSEHHFHGNKIAKTLAEKLGTKGYRFSQSNKNATLTLNYSGTLSSVAESIDFGNVDSTDETSKTITITIP